MLRLQAPCPCLYICRRAIWRNEVPCVRFLGTCVAGIPGQNGFGSLQGGFLETSNVKVVEEMINLISAQRAFEFNSKAVQAADGMLRTLSQMR